MKKAIKHIIVEPWSIIRFMALFLILSDLPADQFPEERLETIKNS